MPAAAAEPADGQLAPPAEWSARYQQHLERGAARAQRTQDLNRALVKRVASGELTPEALDDHFSAFLAARSVAYANRLASTSMRFLTALIGAGTTYSYEMVEAIIPGAVPVPDTVRPDFRPEDWGDWFQRLTDYATAENDSVTSMLRSLMDQVAAGQLFPGDVEEVWRRVHEERLPASVGQLVGLYFDLLAGLDDLHATYGEEYLEAVVGPGRQGAGVGVDLVARAGGEASARLAVANTANEPVAVRCVVTDVRRADGIGPAFPPDVEISPERMEVAPGTEATVVLSIQLHVTRYEPGALYVGTVHVLSPSDTLLELPLRIRAAPASLDAGAQSEAS